MYNTLSRLSSGEQPPNAPFTLSAEQLDEVGGGGTVNGVIVKVLSGPLDAQTVIVHSANGYSYQVSGNRY